MVSGFWGEEIADAHAIGAQKPKISFDSLLKILPRLASMAPLQRFTFDHLLCPAIKFGAK